MISFSKEQLIIYFLQKISTTTEVVDKKEGMHVVVWVRTFRAPDVYTVARRGADRPTVCSHPGHEGPYH